MKVIKSIGILFIIAILLWNNAWLPEPTARAEAGDGIQIVLNTNQIEVDSGDSFTYKINFSFSAIAVSNYDFSKLKITLSLPAGVDYENSIYPSLISGVTNQAGNLTFDFGAAGPTAGSTYSIQVNAHYPGYVTPEGTATTATAQIVEVDGSGNPPVAMVTSDPVTVTAHAKADWELSKTRVSPEPTPRIGGNVQYEIFFNNKQSGTSHGVLDIQNVVLTDTLPAQAVFVSASSGGTYNSGNGTVTWGPIANLHDDQRYYVTVQYPVGSVLPTDTVTNLAHVEYHPLGTDPITGKVQLNASYPHGFTEDPLDNGPGGIHKWVEYREQEISPGQQVHFYINGISNRSNGDLTDATITDITPSRNTANGPVPMKLLSVTTAAFTDAGSTYDVLYATNATADNWQLWKTVDAVTPETLDASLLGASVTGVRFAFDNNGTGTLPISFHQTANSNFILAYELPSSYVVNPAHETVNNTATFAYTFDGAPKHADTSDHVGLTPSRPLVKLDKTVLTSGPFKPEDEVEFEITVTNSDYTSANFQDPIVIDMLPKELQLIAGSWSLSSSSGFQGAAQLVLDQRTEHFNVQDDTLLRWKFDQPVSMAKNDTFKIRFKAKIKKYTPNIQLTNTAEVTSNSHTYINDYYFDPLTTDTQDHDGDGDTSDKLITRKAYLIVNKVVQLESVKQVRGELDNDWQIGDIDHLATTVAGGRVDYKLTVTNESNVDVKNVVVVDVLPRVGDQGVVVNDPRGTTWSTVLTAPIPDIPGTYTVQYSTDNLVKMETGTWTSTPPADLTQVTALKFVFDAGLLLAPGVSKDIIWTMKAPVGTPINQIAWNSFGYKAAETDGSPILSAEPPKVGVRILVDPKSSIGNYVWVDLNENGIQDESVTDWGINGVRVDLLDGTTNLPIQKFGMDVFTVTGNDASGNPGYYLFPNLDPGTYKVRFHLPQALPSGYPANQFSAWTQLAGAGSTALNDSDVTGATAQVTTAPIVLGATPDMTWDAGLLPPKGAIGDFVWQDANGDGIQNEAANKGINGLTVELFKEDATHQWNSQGTTITANKGGNPALPGYYEFTGLLPGNYKVKFPDEDGSGNLLTLHNAGTDRAIDSDANNLFSTANGMTDAIPLRLGEINHSIDAGYVTPVSIGDLTWSDTNDNGIQDAGEPGLVGVTVHLLDTANNPVKKNGIAVVASTDASGHYLFDKLLPGSYKVQFDLPATYGYARQDQGADDARDSDANRTTGRTGSYSLTTPGSSNLTVDAGFVKLVKLGDTVWMDQNRNGLQDAGESGIPNVKVYLYNDESATPNVAVANTLTNASGIYSFTGLLPGRYKVGFVRPDGYLFTTKGVGADAAKDSNTNVPVVLTQTEAKTDQIVLLPGIDDLTIDAGLVELSSVGNFIWRDLNDNGIQDAGENGLSGVTVSLLDADGDPVTKDAYNNDITALTTAADGLYAFNNLLPGDYQVSFTLPAGYWFAKLHRGSDPAVDSDAVPQTNPALGYASVTLGVGEHNQTIDAGALTLASLGDLVWHDLNGNGVQDAGEPGVQGVKVELLDALGAPVTQDAYGHSLAAALTDADGLYRFANLLPGTYQVKFSDLPSGYVFTVPGKGTAATGSDADPTAGASLGKTGTVTLSIGEQNTSLDAGLVSPAAIGDRVWNDKNDNGIQDATDTDQSGVRIELYNAANLLVPQATALTDSTGHYLFTNLWPGDYIVRFILPSGDYHFAKRYQGSQAGADSNADPVLGPTLGQSGVVTLTSGTDDLTIDAGIIALAAIGDTVWEDSNEDGIQNPGEKGHPGVQVELLDGNGDPVMETDGVTPISTLTDGNGNYSFEKLLPGTYQVRFVLPSNYIFTRQNATGSTVTNDSDADTATGKSGTVTLTPGVHDLTVDAGLVKLAALGDYVWLDRNLNGIQDAGEPGIPGVTVHLLNSLGQPVQAGGADVVATTDATGHYLFDQLHPGTYKVAFDLPNGYIFTIQGAGTTATGSDANPAAGTTFGQTAGVTLVSGDYNMDVDAGLIKLVNLGDTLWVDTGRIGQQDGEIADSAASHVTVHLLDEQGNPVRKNSVAVTTTTDANGHYLFTDLYPGIYKVKFDLPAGYLFTRPFVTGTGMSTQNDSNADQYGITDAITLVSGIDDLSVDAGIVLPASLGDFVWEDLNGNGIQDTNEQGVNGVKVELYDDQGQLLDTTTTASAGGLPGRYAFTGLLPGTYSVKFTAPGGYLFTAKQAAGNPALDSDAGLTGETGSLALAPGENNMTIDAGIQVIPPMPPANIGDRVWIDVNGNGIQDINERGLNGVKVELYNRYGALVATKETADNTLGQPGYYLFQNLYPDTFTVKFILPQGYQFTKPLEGPNVELDSNANASGETKTITLQPGINNLSIDAGLIPLSSLGDYVWIDANGNGKQDADEKGLNGVEVTLYDEAGHKIASVLTANDLEGHAGAYLFKDLTPGSYSVQFGLVDGYVFTKQYAAGTNAANDSNPGPDGKTGYLSLPPGTDDRTIDAGLQLAKAVTTPSPSPTTSPAPSTGAGHTGGGDTPSGGKEGGKGGNSGSNGKPGHGAGSPGSPSGGNGSDDGVLGSNLPKTGETPSIYPYIGYSLILLAGILLVLRFKRKKVQ